MKACQIGAIFLAIASFVSFPANAGDPEAGKAKSAVCAACHGADGNSVNPTWPSLAGQHATYLVKQLQDFKAERRVDASMAGMVANLSQQDMEDLAAFFESQAPKAVPFDGNLIATGESIYRGGITETRVAACMGCHSPSGKGNGPAGWPSLHGQHPDYIVAQLQAFKHGKRNNDTGKMMQNVAERMSDEEMASVAAYIAGIQ